MKKSLSFILCFCLVGIFFTANAGLNPELEQLVLHYKTTDQQLNGSNDVHALDPWVAKHGGRLTNKIKQQVPYNQYWPGVDQDVFQTAKDMCSEFANADIPILKHSDGTFYNLPTEEAKEKFKRSIDHLQNLRNQREQDNNVTDIYGNSNTTNLLTASVAIILSYGENVAQQHAIIKKFVKRMLDAEGACLQGQTNRLVGFLVIDVLQYKTSELLKNKRERVIPRYKYKASSNPGLALGAYIANELAQDVEFREFLNQQDIQKIVDEFRLSNEGQQWFDQEIYSQMSKASNVKQQESMQPAQVKKQMGSTETVWRPEATKEEAKRQLKTTYEYIKGQFRGLPESQLTSMAKSETKEDFKTLKIQGERILDILSEQECREFIDSLDKPVASEVDTLEQKLAALK